MAKSRLTGRKTTVPPECARHFKRRALDRMGWLCDGKCSVGTWPSLNYCCARSRAGQPSFCAWPSRPTLSFKFRTPFSPTRPWPTESPPCRVRASRTPAKQARFNQVHKLTNTKWPFLAWGPATDPGFLHESLGLFRVSTFVAWFFPAFSVFLFLSLFDSVG
jgi:hypothetical protein